MGSYFSFTNCSYLDRAQSANLHRRNANGISPAKVRFLNNESVSHTKRSLLA